MTKILEFPEGKKVNDDDNKDGLRLTKEFCRTCGGGLDLWSGSDGVAYGLCSLCDFGVGANPIVGLESIEE